jgi:hypothetical protein
MAREAGADTLMYWDIEKLKRFESLVRADEREAVEDLLKEYDMVNSAFAKDFRARGQPEKIKAVQEDDYCYGDERYYAND